MDAQITVALLVSTALAASFFLGRHFKQHAERHRHSLMHMYKPTPQRQMANQKAKTDFFRTDHLVNPLAKS